MSAKRSQRRPEVVYYWGIGTLFRHLHAGKQDQGGEFDLAYFIFAWVAISAIFIVLATFVVSVIKDDPQPGKEAIQAAVLTVGAEQRSIERNGQYLASVAALQAQEPELNEYFVSGGPVDEYQITSGDRALGVEYQSAGGAIRLAFLDGNLVAVSCNDQIEDCPSAAELYRRAR